MTFFWPTYHRNSLLTAQNFPACVVLFKYGQKDSGSDVFCHEDNQIHGGCSIIILVLSFFYLQAENLLLDANMNIKIAGNCYKLAH